MKKIVGLLLFATDLFGVMPVSHDEYLSHSGMSNISVTAEENRNVSELNGVSKKKRELWKKPMKLLKRFRCEFSKTPKERLIQRIESVSRLPNDAENAVVSQLSNALFEASQTRVISQIERIVKLRNLNDEQLSEELKKLPFPPDINNKLQKAIRSGDKTRLLKIKNKIAKAYRIDEVRIIDINSYMNYLPLEATRKTELLSILAKDDGIEELLPVIRQKVEIENGLIPTVFKYMREGWKSSMVFRRQMLTYVALVESKIHITSGIVRGNSGQGWSESGGRINVPSVGGKRFDKVATIFGCSKCMQCLDFCDFEHEMGHVTDMISDISRGLGMDITETLIPALFGISVMEQKDDDFKKFASRLKKPDQYLDDLKKRFELPIVTDIKGAFSHIQKCKEHEPALMKALMTSSSEVWQIHGLLFLNINGKHVLLLNKIGSDLARDTSMKRPIRSSHLDYRYEAMLLKLGCFSFSRNREIYDPLMQLTCDTTWDEYEKSVFKGGWNTIKQWWVNVKSWLYGM